jgi:amidase
MKRLTRNHLIFAMDKQNQPVLYVDSGERFIVETEDCFSHQIVESDDVLNDNFDYSRVNPATGPIFVNGCQPGDTLKVTIHKIEVESRGVVEVYPGWGPLGNKVEKAETKVVSISEGWAKFGKYLLPLHPMVGVIGVAPAGEAVLCGSPGPHGGNLDTVNLAEGAEIYLPVFVSGAKLALGDIHAIMGDGEICGTGVEIRAEVDIEVEICKSWQLSIPVIKTKESYFFVGSGKTVEEAIYITAEEAVRFIQDRNNLSWTEAYMMASIATDLLFSQVVNPLKTVRIRIPRKIIDE